MGCSPKSPLASEALEKDKAPVAEWVQRLAEKDAETQQWRTLAEERRGAILVLRDAFVRISNDGWAPLDAHLFRPNYSEERMRSYGTRVSLLVAIRHARRESLWDMVDQTNALEAIQECCGMFVFKWEALPLISQEDVLNLVGNAVVHLGGKRPEPVRRRGGWPVSHGAVESGHA